MTHLRGFSDKSKAAKLHIIRGKDERGSPVNDLEDPFICTAQGMSGTEDTVRSRICSVDHWHLWDQTSTAQLLKSPGPSGGFTFNNSQKTFSPWTSSPAAWMQKLLLLIEQQSMSWDHHKRLWTQTSHRIQGARALSSFSTEQVVPLLYTTISLYSLPLTLHFIKAEETSKSSLAKDCSA